MIWFCISFAIFISILGYVPKDSNNTRYGIINRINLQHKIELEIFKLRIKYDDTSCMETRLRIKLEMFKLSEKLLNL